MLTPIAWKVFGQDSNPPFRITFSNRMARPREQLSNAFINPNLPNPLIMFASNPPHVFGAGYIQPLAEEMMEDFQWRKPMAALDAVKNPGKWKPM